VRTDDELEKWNLRFCPKCRGHIQISYVKKDGLTRTLKHCQNHINCDYREYLTTDNIKDIDRHKIIESHFGYNQPFSIDKEDFSKMVNTELLFDSEGQFFDWFILELGKYERLDHNNLPVSSPYWTIIKKLCEFLSTEYFDQLKKAIQKQTDNFSEIQNKNLRNNSDFEYRLLWN